MSMHNTEQLMTAIGEIDEKYIHEYLKARVTAEKSYLPAHFQRKHANSTGLRHPFILAAAIAAMLGTVSLAAVPIIGHLLANYAHERECILKNFDEIEAEYAVPIGDTQECSGVTGTLNSAIVEDHYLLLSYTFDWSGLEEAQDGSFHTWFLPWFFYITEGDRIICSSTYTEGLHTQTYPENVDNDFTATYLYCIDLGDIPGESLTGKELTVQLLYSKDGEGFTSTFTPRSCFTDRDWIIERGYRFGEHEIRLKEVRESALYVTLFLDCPAIGHAGDEYQFILSDELNHEYAVYSYGDDGSFWFTKPESTGAQLTLKIVRSHLKTDSVGQIIDDSYEVLYEIPIELN